MTITNPNQSYSFDPATVEKLHEETVKLLQEVRPTVDELLIFYGNLGYTLGASIEGFKNKGPGIEELKKLYYTNPTVGVSLMLTGLTITTWLEDYHAQQRVRLTSEEPNKEKENQGDK